VTLVWIALTGWALCGIGAGALLLSAFRRPTTTSDERFAAADDLITERERAAMSCRQDRRRAL
jgi:hypothetical protein